MAKDKWKKGFEFHAHLDVCEQCEKHPFDLCPVGVRLLMELRQDHAENPSDKKSEFTEK